VFLAWSWKNILAVALAAVAVVAFCVAVVFAAPIVIGSVSVLIPGLGSVPSFVALGIFVAAGIAAIITEMIPDGDGVQAQPKQEVIIITIEKDEERITEGTVFYIEPDSFIDFYITVRLPSPDDKVTYGVYDSFNNNWGSENSGFFSAKTICKDDGKQVDSDDALTDLPFDSSMPLPTSFILRISRNSRPGTGYDEGGFDFVLLGTKSLVVNDSSNYFDIYNPASNNMVNTNSVYILHLTILEENARQ